MLRHHLKIALRNLRKHSGYAFINVAGLALGMACCVMMMLFVRDELSYDRFHEHADRLYRVVIDAQPPNASLDRFAFVSQPVGRALRADMAEIETVVRINNWSPSVAHEEVRHYDDVVRFAEAGFFEMFTFPLHAGNPATALEAPYTAVLTETTARKYFGTTDALGRTLTFNDTLDVAVTGVMADFPPNAHFSADMLVSYATLIDLQPGNDDGDDWLSLGTYTYVLVREGASLESLRPRVAGLMTTYFGAVLNQIGFTATLGLQPLTDIHLHSDRQGELGANGNLANVYLFSAIALFILLIACINFMNLATARSMERAKEVGVRKVVGSSRAALMRQFLGESAVMSGLALLLALGLIALALPFFNDLSGKALAFATLLAPLNLLWLVGLTLMVGILAGSYPALVLSGFTAIDVLKGSFRATPRGIWLRKGLVVFQFAISIALMVGTALIFEQLDFMQRRDLGFDKEQVLVIDAQHLSGSRMAEQYTTVKAELMRHPAVRAVSATTAVPGRNAWLQIYNAEGLDENDSRRAEVLPIDHDYVETLGLEVVAGRGFSEQFQTDAEGGILVNEAAVANIGWGTPEDALGKTISFGGPESPQRTVVGVIRDYHHHALTRALEPMLLLINPPAYNYFALRLATDDLAGTRTALEATWHTLFPGDPFNTFFLDADFEAQYAAEQQLTRISGTFAFLAILIACLGLFGLAAFTAAQRTKEIGVRKVLGASVPQIIGLLSKEFTLLVLVALVLAIPVAYVGMDRWLDAFPYRIDIGPLVFLGIGLMTLAIAFLTVSYQSIRAALSDPVKSLRSE